MTGPTPTPAPPTRPRCPAPRTTSSRISTPSWARRPDRVRTCSSATRWAGSFARLYASRYPDQVAGLVLVDASHEEQDQRRQAMVSADLFAAEQQAVNSNSEGIDLAASFAQMSAATPLVPMPLVVLSAGVADPAFFPPGWPMEAEAKLHAELQADLAGLVPGWPTRCRRAERPLHPAEPTRPDRRGDPGRSPGSARPNHMGNPDPIKPVSCDGRIGHLNHSFSSSGSTSSAGSYAAANSARAMWTRNSSSLAASRATTSASKPMSYMSPGWNTSLSPVTH